MKLSLEEDESLLAERAAALLRVPAGKAFQIQVDDSQEQGEQGENQQRRGEDNGCEMFFNDDFTSPWLAIANHSVTVCALVDAAYQSADMDSGKVYFIGLELSAPFYMFFTPNSAGLSAEGGAVTRYSPGGTPKTD